MKRSDLSQIYKTIGTRLWEGMEGFYAERGNKRLEKSERSPDVQTDIRCINWLLNSQLSFVLMS